MLIHEKMGDNRGFTLIELAIVMAVGAVMTLTTLKFVVPIYEQAKRMETTEKLRVINEALETYALNSYRLPCPADPRRVPSGGEPHGAERFSGTDGNTIPANCGGTVAFGFGIVPYKTLGLPEDAIYDSWGNYITYAITSSFALDVTDINIRVHPACRTQEWYYPKDDTDTYVHKNPRKARFCCVSQTSGNNIYIAASSDLTITSRVGGTYASVLATSNPRTASGLGAPNTCTDCEAYATTSEMFSKFPNINVPASDVSTGIAFILVSHGANGYGAFQDNASRFRPTDGGPDEDENADIDRAFVDRSDQSDSSTDYYDDIVLWRTQDAMFAEQGESCAKP